MIQLSLDKINILQQEQDLITSARKMALQQLAEIIRQQVLTAGSTSVNFVCTHNSRRSQLAQVWFWYALQHFNIKDIHSFSSGTEATAFNHRMVEALRRFGFDIEKLDESDNPKYLLKSTHGEELSLFSKTIEHDANPSDNFIAVMVCDHAEENCPFVPSAVVRFSLNYIDPKRADNSPEEQSAYDNKVREIGREMLYLTGCLKGLEE